MRILFGGFEKFSILLILLKACVHIFASLHLRQAGSSATPVSGQRVTVADQHLMMACAGSRLLCVGWLDNIGVLSARLQPGRAA